jgi:hypothetical protein
MSPASQVVRGTPEHVFRELSAPGETQWMLPFSDGEELEKVNKFASICYHQSAYVRVR